MDESAKNFIRSVRKSIRQAQCISFDFFDTLFVRPLLDPEDVFDILARELKYPDFKQRRRVAQQKAFQKMAEQGDREITLAGIYAEFPESDVALRQRMMQAEYDLELRIIEPNPVMCDLLKECLGLRKRVVVTSDMYLPREFFETALRQHGFAALPCFISADKNATKRDRGELFEILQQEVSLPAQMILHIGDNAMSDVARARETGMQAVHYSFFKRLPAFPTVSLEQSIAAGLLTTRISSLDLSNYGELGFLYGGAAGIGFLNWIRQQATLDHADHILFLSRDGYVLNRLAQARNDFGNINFHYFLGSRVAFTLAAITPENFEGFIPTLLSGGDGLLVSELLERIGVQAPAANVMQDLGFGHSFRVAPENYLEVATFLRAYRSAILRVAALNRRALYQYLQALNIQRGNTVALVDVGWSGTTQAAFERAVADMMELRIEGYYFCLVDTPKRIMLSLSQSMKGLLTAASLSSDAVSALYQNRVAVEMMFSAPHHTVIGLSPTPSGIQAIFDPGRGSCEEANALLAISRDINQGIEAFTEHYNAFLRKLALTQMASPVELTKPLMALALSDDNADINHLQSVRNFDAWGSSRNHQNRSGWLSQF